MTGVLPGSPAWSPLHRRCRGAVFASPIYRLTLPRHGPPDLSTTPPNAWPGDADRGAAIVDNVFTLAGTRMRATASPFDELGADPAWRDALHEFTWLRDLRALGGDPARARARALIADWLNRHEHWSAEAWRADILGRRLAAWTSHYRVFFASAADALRPRLLASMTRQARHLGRVAGREVDGLARIAAIKGALYAGLCIPGEDALLTRARQLLESELARQIGDDGGHAGRGPANQLALLRDLIDMRAALAAGKQDASAALDDAVAKTASMLRLFRHGDGGLANFNGGGEDPAAAGFTLDLAKARGQPPMRAVQCGFERLAAGKLLVIADTGAPAAPGFDTGAHAGTLSFEASFGKERLIVNCGAAPAAGPEWRAAARATAAHSTLALEDTNSSELRNDGTLGQRPGAVTATRDETDGNVWLSLSHDGYAAAFGLIHRRRLYLAAPGDELRGEDSLHPAPGARDGAQTHAYAIRFHIHPTVRVSMAQDGATVVLRQPSGIGWRMRVGGARVDLAESVYFGGDEARRTQQIVLSGRTGADTTTVQWALRREGA